MDGRVFLGGARHTRRCPPAAYLAAERAVEIEQPREAMAGDRYARSRTNTSGPGQASQDGRWARSDSG